MAVGMGLLGALGIPDPSPILVGDTGAGAPVRQSEWVAGACAPALHSSAAGVLPPQDRISWDTSERTAARGVIAVRRTTRICHRAWSDDTDVPGTVLGRCPRGDGKSVSRVALPARMMGAGWGSIAYTE